MTKRILSAACAFTVASLAQTAAADPDPALSCADIVFPGGAHACRDYTGDAWTPITAGADCAAIPGVTSPGTFAAGSSCDTTAIIGTCVTDRSTTDEALIHFNSGDPATLQTSCEAYLHGEWVLPITGSCDHMMVFGPPGTPAMPVCKEYDATWEGAVAQADCDALSQSAFSDLACTDSPLGTCTILNQTLYFYMGDAATLQTGCETAPPYGLGGVWTPTQVASLPVEVVEALTSDSSLSVAPDACVDDACLGAVVSAGGAITFQPADGSATRGLVIYPGGMVEPRSYAVAARQIAAQGFFVAIVPFAGNLAITDPMRGLSTVMANPQIQHWAVAGHSLGGVAASIWALANPAGKLEGIAFWASYPAPASGQGPGADLSASSLKGISITGTHDGVLNWTAYEDTKAFLPAATYVSSIRGGNHAQFGYYGDQDGDQAALIGRDRQHELFSGATVHLLNRLGLEPEQDVIDPVYERIGDVGEPLCTSLQLHIAGMRVRDLRRRDIVFNSYMHESEFISSKPEFPVDGSGLIAITEHARQGANPWDVTAPPIFDSEIMCKMKSQEAIAAQYGMTPRWEAGSCAAANAWTFDYAMAEVDFHALLGFWFSGTGLSFGEDRVFGSGPAWLATGVSLLDLGDNAYEVRASALHTTLDGAPPPYNGNDYCRVWSPQAAAQFIVAHGSR